MKKFRLRNKAKAAGGAERRSDERSKVNFRIQLMRADSLEVEGVVTDLSPGGCFVECGAEVGEDELVKLRLNVPGRGELTIWGNVVRRAGRTGFGVRFSAFSQGGARDKLAEIISGQVEASSTDPLTDQ
ncbi:MAG: PilZ domain-containing protein [Acidobacteria bacterium]|nr:PilZ domain-containing protein [Acidobacteriota bacterium]